MWIRTPRGIRLAAELRRSRGQAVIVMAHGFCDNRHSFGRFDRLADGFAAAGYDVLTFDFSGCGESDPDVVQVRTEVEDFRAVLAWLRDEGYERIGVYGHSLGGTIALLANDGLPEAMVLAGTPTGAMSYDWLDYYGPRRMKELNDTGVLRIGPWTLTHQSLKDFEELDQRVLLGSVKCPVLLVHGGHGNDWEEQELLRLSRKGRHLLPFGSAITVVDGAGHSFSDHIPQVLALAQGWFGEHLPLP
ncbi:alpha/beta fold hydrolase [Actinocrispum sp. NPDC049592]|uniref:alpha/beta hydrolase family protein n=1 Tax=Actinocrispum sp. NPDC049592 TaxID=3154835 RepID=UPI0034125F78